MEHEEVVQSVINYFRADQNVELVARGHGDFPNPDVRVQYRRNKIAFVECKPSDAGGREYLTGFGQAIAYLVRSHLSYLAIPEREMEEYKKFFWVGEVGLLKVLEDESISFLRNARESRIRIEREKPMERGYGYYRDLRPREIHEILKAIESIRVRYKGTDREIKNRVRDKIWERICKLRNIRSNRQKHSWLLNIHLLLRDLGLMNEMDYTLTEEGFRLLRLGDLRRTEPYLAELAKCFLINANYLDVVTLIQNLNDMVGGFGSVGEFKELLSEKMKEEKLATSRTNVMRDLQDIPRILKDLGILSEWRKVGLTHRFSIDWKTTLKIIRT